MESYAPLKKATGFPLVRPRRIRQQPRLRSLIREHTLAVEDLVLPVFIKHGNNLKNPITSMPGQYQWSIDRVEELIEQAASLSIPAIFHSSCVLRQA